MKRTSARKKSTQHMKRSETKAKPHKATKPAVVRHPIVIFKPKAARLSTKKEKPMEDKETKDKEKAQHDKPEEQSKSTPGGGKAGSGKGNGEGGSKGSAGSAAQGKGQGDESVEGEESQEPDPRILGFVQGYIEGVNPPAPAPGEGGGNGEGDEGSKGQGKSGKSGGGASEASGSGNGGNGKGNASGGQEQTEGQKKQEKLKELAKQMQELLEKAQQEAGGGKKPGMVPYAVDKWPPPDEQEAAQHFFAGDCYKAKERAQEEQRYKKQIEQLQAAYKAAGQSGAQKGSPEEAGAASLQGFPSGATPDARQQQASKENAGSEDKGPGGAGYTGRTSPGGGGGGGGQQHGSGRQY